MLNNSGHNQTLLSPGHQNPNNSVFVASPLSSQRHTMQNSSPIRMSPTQQQDQLVYGDPTLTSPYRRYKKTL